MKKNFYTKGFLYVALLSLTSNVFGQLASWDFAGTNGAASSPADVVVPNLETASPYNIANLASGLTAFNYASTDGLEAKDQTANTLAEAITGNDYISVKIKPKQGNKVTITSVDLRPFSQNRVRYFALFSNVAGFSESNVLGIINFSGNFGSSTLFNLSIANHANITSEVEFRIYIYGYNSKYEACGLSGSGAGADLQLNGTVEAAFTPINTHKEVQLGLGGLAYYAKPLFANAMYMENRSWRPVDTAYPLQADQLDANGFPLYLTPGQQLYVQPGQNSAAHRAAYGGRICLTWEGDADIRATSTYLTSPTPSSGSYVNGKRYYNNGATPNGITVKVYAINPANPPKNIKIWLTDLRDPSKSLDPAEQGGKEYLLNPAYSDLFANEAFYLYRFMDLTETNNSPIVNWADRRIPTHCFQKGLINNVEVGISYETAIAICNEFGKDMWINIPAQANEDFVKKLAALINGQDPDGIGSPGLNPNLRCYVEYGNEMGWTYWASYCTEKGALEGINGRQYAGRQAARVHSWFRSVVGPENERFKMIHAIQTSAYSTSDQELEQSCLLVGPTLSPSGVPDYIGFTSYFGSSIEQFVFNDINYWDPAVKDAELLRVFDEFERRTLSGTASVTGVDFTGGGVSQAAKDLSAKYGLPLIAYEGGCGLNMSGSKCQVDCKLVPSGTTGATCAYFMKDLAANCGGSTNFLNFIKAVHTHPLMKKMFEINSTLAKANGVETITQFGDVADVNGNIDYGYWACVNDLSQDPTTAYRYQFWLDWFNEQKDIREVGNPQGSAPHFDTPGELYPGKEGNAYSQEIHFSGGDGTLAVKLISRADMLPQSLNFSIQSGKIVISGTPQPGDAGTYYMLYRLLDVDKDPAFAAFTLKILPAPMDSVFAYDDFGTIQGPLHGANNGYGFSGAWTVQDNSTTAFSTETSTPITYSGLQSSGNAYALGGGSYKSAGRVLNVAAFDYLRNSTNTSVIGQTNTSLWFSALVQRSTSASNDIFRFINSGYYQSRNDAEVILKVDANGKFALDVRNSTDDAFITTASTIDATVSQTFLVVIEFRFDLTQDLVNVYINPAPLGATAPTGAAAMSYITPTGQNLIFTKYGFYGNSSATVSIDDIRFGDTYKAVTPVEESALFKNLTTQNEEIAVQWVVHPNPVNQGDVINVSNNNIELITIHISDLQGRIVSILQEKSNKVEVPTANLQKGMYVLKINAQGNTVSKKIIIK